MLDVNAINEDNQTPLIVALLTSNQQAITTLVQAHADSTLVPPGEEKSPIEIAIDKNNIPALNVMLNHIEPSKLNHQNPGTGQTPLTYAISKGNDIAVSILLSLQANPTFPNSTGQTPLAMAEASGNEDIIRKLQESIKRNKQEESAPEKVFEAILHNNQEALVAVLKHHPNAVNALNSKKETPLIAALVQKNNELVKVLLAHSPNANLATSTGQSPLALAVATNNIDAINLLLQASGFAEVNPNFLNPTTGDTAAY